MEKKSLITNNLEINLQQKTKEFLESKHRSLANNNKVIFELVYYNLMQDLNSLIFYTIINEKNLCKKLNKNKFRPPYLNEFRKKLNKFKSSILIDLVKSLYYQIFKKENYFIPKYFLKKKKTYASFFI